MRIHLVIRFSCIARTILFVVSNKLREKSNCFRPSKCNKLAVYVIIFAKYYEQKYVSYMDINRTVQQESTSSSCRLHNHKFSERRKTELIVNFVIQPRVVDFPHLKAFLPSWVPIRQQPTTNVLF